MGRTHQLLTVILLGLCSSSMHAAEPLKVYSPSPFVAWLAEHIAADAVRVSHQKTDATTADLRFFIEPTDASATKAALPNTIYLSDGLPKITRPAGLEHLELPGQPNRWLNVQQVLFMAVGFTESLIERLPEKADALDNARTQFTRTIRLEDFQIKRRLRAIEQPVRLSSEMAQALYPLLSYYGVACEISEESESVVSLQEPSPGDSSEAPFVAATNWLLER